MRLPWTIMVLVILLPTALVSADESLRTQLAKQCKLREDHLKSFGVNYEYSKDPDPKYPQIGSEKAEIHARHKGAKRIYLCGQDKTHTYERDYSFDGKKCYLMNYLAESNSLSVQKGPASELMTIKTPYQFFFEDLGGNPLSKIAQAVDSEIKHEGPFVLLTASEQIGASRKVWRYYFDPQTFALRRFDLSLNGIRAKEGEVLASKTTSVSGVRIDIPTSMVLRVYNAFGKGEHIYDEKLRVEEVEINKNDSVTCFL